MINFFKKSFDHEMKLLKKSKTFSIISTFLQKIRSNLINIVVLRKKHSNNFCLQTLFEICKKKNHFAIFKNQHMYIEFKMIDIKTNIFKCFIALYSIENYNMFRKCDQMIAIFTIQISYLTLKFLNFQIDLRHFF